MLIELNAKGEIKGYGSNFKVLRKDGITQPGLLEVTGRRRGVATCLMVLPDAPKK